MTERVVRIGGAAAGYGDGAWAAPILLRDGEIDYIVFDFLSEYYMPMAARDRAANPAMGYLPYFPDEFYPRIAAELADRNVKMIVNAGACNPRACGTAVEKAAARLGIAPRIAVVDGDDLIGRAAALRAAGKLSAAMPEGVGYTGIHAYLGAFPIARALDLGADIVITGRIVDSALVVGPLIHEFGWKPTEYDLLAAGSTIGHILECGAQASGGLFTDWEQIEDYSNIGYGIAEVRADGTAIITKPRDTGGIVCVGTVAEQLVYEIDDPRNYRLPDVTVDFSGVTFEQVGKDQVLMTGAKGRAPGPDYKVNANWDDGWFGAMGFYIRGPDAAAKARRNAEATFKRARTMLLERNMAELRRTNIEVVGDEESYGAHGRKLGSREIFCRMAMESETAEAFHLVFRENNTGMTSFTPGMTSTLMMMGPMPMARQESCFVPAVEVPARVLFEGREEVVERFDHPPARAVPDPVAPPEPPASPDTLVPLRQLAFTRSGDKGNACNVGVIARKPEYLPYIAAAMSEAAVADYYAFQLEGKGSVTRYYLPGCNGLNFMLNGALDGGCTVSLRLDAMGKSASQDALDIPIPVPQALLD
jgi:hypothetical protein